MYPLETDPTAIQIIQRSMTCHPTTFSESLQSRIDQDCAYAMTRDDKATRQAVDASMKAASRAIYAVLHGKAEDFASDMGAGIIALNIACKLQCLPAYVRTSAAVKTWESANA